MTIAQHWGELGLRIWADKARALDYENQPIMIYCAGDRGKYAYFTLRDMGYKVVGFIDDSPEKHGSTFYGLPVRSSVTVPLGTYIVVSVQTVEAQAKILARMRKTGFDGASIGEFVYPAYWKHLHEVFESLADERSKEVLYHVLLAHYEQDSRHFLPICEDRQYWCMGFLEHSKEHVFVDAGAYTGDTMYDFVKLTHGEFSEIISFEPTPDLYRQVCERMLALRKRWGLGSNVLAPILAGLGDVDCDLPLVYKDSDPNGAGNSFYDLAERTGETTRVWTLDSFREGFPVTFIKADIEGYELNMLKGAKKTIQAYKPDLAICVYHKMVDLWEIPLYIKSLVPEYKLYMRHHHDDYSETVLYASIV